MNYKLVHYVGHYTISFNCTCVCSWKGKDIIALVHIFLTVLSLMIYIHSCNTIPATVRMSLPFTVASGLRVGVIRDSGMSVHAVALHLPRNFSAAFQIIESINW
jgi:hypothetical protein